MPANRSSGPNESPRAGNTHRLRTLTLPILLSGAFALILYIHGAWWWYAALTVVGVLLAHVLTLVAIAFVARRVTAGWHAHGGTTSWQDDTDRSPERESILLHKPRHFDLLARVIMLGRERKFRLWTLDVADLQPENAVLDVGCGTGTLLLTAAERVAPLGALHGIEPSTEMAAHARRKAQAQGAPLVITQGSADSLPYPPASFDCVLSTLVFHHLPRSMQERAIREMRRVFRPGGRAVIVDWERPKSFARAIISPMFLVYLLHKLRPSDSPLDAPGIEPLMRELGFKDIQRCSFGTGGGIGAVVSRLASATPVVNQAELQSITHPHRKLTERL